MSGQRGKRIYKGQGSRSASGALAYRNCNPLKVFNNIKGLWFQLLLRSRSEGVWFADFFFGNDWSATVPFSSLKGDTSQHSFHLLSIDAILTLACNDFNWLLLGCERRQVSLLLVPVNVRSWPSASAWVIWGKIIWLQFSKPMGKYSFHHLPIFPAWHSLAVKTRYYISDSNVTSCTGTPE